MIACEELVLACPVGHRFAGGTNVSLTQLKGEAFIDFQSSWGTRLIVDRAFAEAAIDRKIAFEVTDLPTLLDLVARGLGVALVPAPLALARAEADQALPIATAQLARPEICWELVLAFAARGGRGALPSNPAACAFIDVLREARGLQL
jgi:DNA-binding transcriptional LysR family regulator